MKSNSDFLIIGSGIAGLSYALKVADLGKVDLVTKREISTTATNLAQGGIASVFLKEDTFDSHFEDTMRAGAWLCDENAVRLVVENGPKAIKDLIDWGVEFTRREDHSFDLTKEGGHSNRRIFHAKDATGREIERALVAAVFSHPNITVYENHCAVDLITESKVIGCRSQDKGNRCLGAYVLDNSTGRTNIFQARVTTLATGGCGKVYLFTTNPDTATGDGIAMAYRAGASVANMEFMQFHPTTLFHPHAKSFLISEAVRGEGAVLRRADGTAFMADYHALKDLAPRDIVARAIDSEMKRYGDDCVYLDLSSRSSEFIRDRFPTIYENCLTFGIDITKEMIPVVPAAHYLCGGIKVDTMGESDLPNLFAIGEVAYTGVHGANRLASNSLLEGVVYADRAAQKGAERFKTDWKPAPKVQSWDTGSATDSNDEVVVSHNWDEIRRAMWNYVGIVRSTKRLDRALRRIRMVREECDEYYWNFFVTSDLLELRNIVTVAELIVQSALARTESRGLHYNVDYPEVDDEHWNHPSFLNRMG